MKINETNQCMMGEYSCNLMQLNISTELCHTKTLPKSGQSIFVRISRGMLVTFKIWCWPFRQVLAWHGSCLITSSVSAQLFLISIIIMLLMICWAEKSVLTWHGINTVWQGVYTQGVTPFTPFSLSKEKNVTSRRTWVKDNHIGIGLVLCDKVL